MCYLNKKLAAAAAQSVRAAGGEANLIDMADYSAPVYDGDIEEASGLPESMQRFRALVASTNGLLVVTPEYNGCIPPLLVNTFNWASRADGEDTSKVFSGKIFALAAASPGRLGGVRVIPRLRDFVSELGAMTVPGFATLPGAFSAFDESGNLQDETVQGVVDELAKRLVDAL